MEDGASPAYTPATVNFLACKILGIKNIYFKTLNYLKALYWLTMWMPVLCRLTGFMEELLWMWIPFSFFILYWNIFCSAVHSHLTAGRTKSVIYNKINATAHRYNEIFSPTHMCNKYVITGSVINLASSGVSLEVLAIRNNTVTGKLILLRARTTQVKNGH